MMHRKLRELHDQAQTMSWSTKLVEGNVSATSYIQYLKFFLEVFRAIEEDNEIDPRLCRVKQIENDLKTFGSYADDVVTPPVARPYADYIRGCSEWKEEELNAHIYLNYGGILFGGSIIGANIPYSGFMYSFMGAKDLREYIKNLNYDEDQAVVGMQYHLDLFNYLEGPLDDDTRISKF